MGRERRGGKDGEGENGEGKDGEGETGRERWGGEERREGREKGKIREQRRLEILSGSDYFRLDIWEVSLRASHL
mgnify:CR=1 FL=1